MTSMARNRVGAVVSIVVAVLGGGASHTVLAETVVVKYRRPVDLSHFSCPATKSSSLVQRLCYDAREKYLLVSLNGVYYHYCGVPQHLVTAWQAADSLGRFYNAEVKGSYDCRSGHVPSY
jgi:hypothetical protein